MLQECSSAWLCVSRTKGTGSALTGTFILKSSLLNLKAMSERVLWKNPVGRRTRTSCRFAGKDACEAEEGLGAFATSGPGHGTDVPLQLMVGIWWMFHVKPNSQKHILVVRG